ncbi:hypothetical protein BKA93DRAFT_818015 [Sparassis latifolia]
MRAFLVLLLGLFCTGATWAQTLGSRAANPDFTGDIACTDVMCISALVNGSTVQYVLQTTNAAPLGYMAIGLGTVMAKSPMVVMWSNSDGTITLSQRESSSHAMPTVVANPPFTATSDPNLSSLSGSNEKFAYTMPLNSSATTQKIIYAFGTENPGSSSASASIAQHIFASTLQLNLAQPVSAASLANFTDPVTNSPSGGTVTLGLLPFEKLIVAHGIICVIGFLVLLPAGALLARYFRTFTTKWFKAHWIVQFAFGGVIILVGWGLGIAAVQQSFSGHFNDDHKKWGLALFVLYILQIVLGAVIHYWKPGFFLLGGRRPIQNYFHAVFGLVIIGLSFYQVRTGYRDEWEISTGRGISNAANIVWYIWIVLLPVLYLAGLALLPRQFKQERVTKPDPSASYNSGATAAGG